MLLRFYNSQHTSYSIVRDERPAYFVFNNVKGLSEDELIEIVKKNS
jgi:hypothetical protein